MTDPDALRHLTYLYEVMCRNFDRVMGERDALRAQVAMLREALIALRGECGSNNIHTWDGWQVTSPFFDLPDKTSKQCDAALATTADSSKAGGSR